MNDIELVSIIEGMLFINGDEGIDIKQIEKILQISSTRIKSLILLLKEKYKLNKHGLTIQLFANSKFRLTTLLEHHQYYLELQKQSENYKKLSQPSLEVLSIIAYKGPITKMEIEKIRGVNSDYLVNKLRDLEFIKELKTNLPGRPISFKVTSKFMKIFNLKSLNDLPKIDFEFENEIKDLFS